MAIFFSWGLARAVAVVVAVEQVVVLGSDIFFSVCQSGCKSKYYIQ